MAKSRRLKIQRKSQARMDRWITIPEIRLGGKWLDRLGFKQGQTVIIAQQKNKLTITVEKGRG